MKIEIRNLQSEGACWLISEKSELGSLGDSRKYPYHTSEFRGQGGGGSLNWKSEGRGEYLRLEF